MPTYDYKCDACGASVEKFHSMSDTPVVVCSCGSTMAKQISGGCGVIFKGQPGSSGFYKLDYQRTEQWNQEDNQVAAAKRRAFQLEKEGKIGPPSGGDVITLDDVKKGSI